MMETSATEDNASEYTDWEIPPDCVEVLKQHGCITSDEQGQLILKQDCVEKARKIVSQLQNGGGQQPPLPPPQQAGYFEQSIHQNTIQSRTGQPMMQESHVQASSRSDDEMMVAQFMAGLPQPSSDQVGPQCFQRPPGPVRGSPSSRNAQFTHLDANDIKKMYPSPTPLRKGAGDSNAAPKPRKTAEKGPAKPRKPTKKQLAAAAAAALTGGQGAEAKTGELLLPVPQPTGYRVVGPSPTRMPKVGLVPVIPQSGGRLVAPPANLGQTLMPPPVRNSAPQAMLIQGQNNQTYVLSSMVRGPVLLSQSGHRQHSPMIRPVRATTDPGVLSAVISDQAMVRPQSEVQQSQPMSVTMQAGQILRPGPVVSLPSGQMVRAVSVSGQVVRTGTPVANPGQIVSYASNCQNGQRDEKIVEMRSAGYLLGHLPHTSSLMQQRQDGPGKKKKVTPVPIQLNGAGVEGSRQPEVSATQQVQQIVASGTSSNVEWSQESGVVYANQQSTGVRAYIAHTQNHELSIRQQGSVESGKVAVRKEFGGSEFQQQFLVSVGVNPNASPQKGGGKNKRKNKQSLESRMYWTENPPFVHGRKVELLPIPSSAASPVVSRIQPVPAELVRQTEHPIRPKEPTHIPKFIPGKLALCGNCGNGSKDVARCHTCGRNLPTDVRLVDDTRTGDGARPVDIKPLPKGVGTGTVVVRKVVAAIPAELTPTQPQPQTASPKDKLKRPPGRKKKVHEEPECLTLSSDDENEKKESPKSQEIPKVQEEQDDLQIEELDVTKLIEGDDLMDYCMGYMQVAKFGIYNSKIDEKSKRMFLVETGIHIPVENIEGEATSVWIPKEHINLIEYNMDGRIRLVAIHVVPKMARWIRNRLKIRKEDNMFDVDCQDAARKRILIALDPAKTKTEDCKQRLLKHFGTLVQERSDVEVSSILASYAKVVISYVDAKQQTPGVVNQTQDTIKIVEKRQPFVLSRTLFTYPPAPEKGGISITGEDYVCLEDEQFLNDSMIDFYMKYLHMTTLPQAERDRIHIFSTYFYKRLTHRPTSKRRPAFEDDPSLTPEEKRHCRVKSWTKNVDIFDKDYLLVPICEKSHWFLAIICFPYLQGPVRAKDNTPVVLPPTPKRKPRKKQGTEGELGTPTKTFMIGSTTITPVGGATLEEIKAATLTIPDDSDRDEAESDSELDEGPLPSDEGQASTPESSQPVSENAPSGKEQDESDNQPALPRSESHTNVQNSSSDPSTPTGLKPQNVVVSQSTLLTDNVEGEPVKQPCVLVFDSLEGPSRGKIVATLREYLRIEYKVKKGEDRPFKDFVKGVMLRVPQQTNYSDCGLYVLQYAENFFEDNPIKDFRTPIPSMRKWFDPMVVIRKREDLGNLIITLTEEQNPGLAESLPILRFPTLEGELIHSEDEEEGESYEHSSSNSGALSSPDKKLPQMGTFHVITPAWRDGQDEDQHEDWEEEQEVLLGSEEQHGEEGEWSEGGDWEEDQGEWEGPMVEEIAGEVEVNAEIEGDDCESSQKTAEEAGDYENGQKASETDDFENSQKLVEGDFDGNELASETIVTVTSTTNEILRSTDQNFQVTSETEDDVTNSDAVPSDENNRVEITAVETGQVTRRQPQKLLKILAGDNNLVRSKDTVKRTKSDPVIRSGKGPKRQKLVDYADSEDSS